MTVPRCDCGCKLYWAGVLADNLFDVFMCSGECINGQQVVYRGMANMLPVRDGVAREREPGDEPRLLPMRPLPESATTCKRAYRGKYKRKGEGA